jgi:L-threonylcarbamoyladenylate synthase
VISCPCFHCDLSDISSIDAAVQSILKVNEKEGVWIAPSETIYGISGNGLSVKTIKRIQKIKNRGDAPFIFLVKDVPSAQKYAQFDTLLNTGLLSFFKEGGFTFVFNSKIDFLGKTIALRMATDPVSQSLLKNKEFPMISTSANSSGVAYNDSPDKIYREFCRKVDFVVDAGSLGNSQSSTIVDVTGEKGKILRMGVGFEKIRGHIE